MTKIRCQSESQMAVLTAGARKQPTGISMRRRATATGKSIRAPRLIKASLLELAVQGRRLYCAVGIRSVIA